MSVGLRVRVLRPFTFSALKRFSITDRIRRRATWIGLAALLLFWVWIGWPYFHAIVVRDAAVTTWLNLATAPIAGDLTFATPDPGSTIGPDGRLAEIVNPRADRTTLERARGELAAAEARLAQRREARSTREALVARYAAAFKQQLDVELAHATSTLRYVNERLAAERTDASRFSALREAGSASTADAEAATARVAFLEGERVTTEGSLARTSLRRESADRGLYLLDDGSTSSWDAHLDLLRAQQELVAAEAECATARRVAEAARETFERQHTARLVAPAGAQLWHRYTAPGATVNAGDPVVAWIDPTVLLVDVPLSDVEAALLHPGARAHVVIEGSRGVRSGVVLFTRGSTSTLGARELAAVAKGRRAGIGQAIVQLEAGPEDRTHSPIGRAAYVDFPDVGIFSIIRARLRW